MMTNSEKKLLKVKTNLMRNHFGLASIMMSLEFIQDESINTMATDGKVLLYSEKFIEEHDEKTLSAVIIHEVLHVIFEHPYNRGDRNPKLWNVACDYCINEYVTQELHMSLPANALLDRQYFGMSEYKIYSILDNDDEALQKAKDQMTESDMPQDENADNSADTSSNAEGDQEETDKYSDIPDSIGEIIDPTDEEGKPLDEAKKQDLVKVLKRNIYQAEKLASFDGSSDLRGIVEKININNINWLDYVSVWLTDIFGEDQSYQRPDKNHIHRGVYLPSTISLEDGGELAVAIDTSGSVCQEELNFYASVIEQLCQELNITRLRVCYCDTHVHKNKDGDWWDTFDIEAGEEVTLEARGFGGTNFNPPFKLLNEFSEDTENISAFIYFTDGYGQVDIENEPDVPTLWAITTYNNDIADYQKQGMPFGDFVPVNISQLRI